MQTPKQARLLKHKLERIAKSSPVYPKFFYCKPEALQPPFDKNFFFFRRTKEAAVLACQEANQQIKTSKKISRIKELHLPEESFYVVAQISADGVITIV